MSVIPEPPDAASTTAKREGFWQRLMVALDQHFVERSKRAVSAVTLRNSKRDMDRCRRLMHEADAVPSGARLHRVAQTRQRP
jgi:hypothetical protein